VTATTGNAAGGSTSVGGAQAVDGVGMVNGYRTESAATLPSDVRARIDRRSRALGPGYQLFYEQPLVVTRAAGVHLFDERGNAYLDAYNNVASLGHNHPYVVEAITRQLQTLNTNTRYLQDSTVDCAEQLLATLPDRLDRVVFTCTGSEANDLALRICAAHTGARGVIVTANAYHGVTEAVAGISPSLGPGVDLAPFVRVVPAPDPRVAGSADAGAVASYMSAQVRAAADDLRRHGYGLSAFVADSVFSSDGVFAAPVPWLREVARTARAAGGLYVADEVQAGMGRLGDRWWGFERHDVVPDLVTIGKPLGNGYPVAAVALQHAVGEAFGSRARYFNTFGGSTVATAAASAVLTVLDRDDLVRRAAATGAHLRSLLTDQVAPLPGVGDVRGTGMFWAVEMSAAGIPDGARTRAVVNAMRAAGVLVSASGPAGNVVKIRPPLIFGRAHAEQLVDALATAIAGTAPSKEKA
jgi:4-aminobutyrate aminotransferase-like enzyme